MKGQEEEEWAIPEAVLHNTANPQKKKTVYLFCLSLFLSVSGLSSLCPSLSLSMSVSVGLSLSVCQFVFFLWAKAIKNLSFVVDFSNFCRGQRNL